MVNKYVRVLEEREINAKTGEVWSLFNVPNTWKSRVEVKVLQDGYVFLEDGTAVKPVPNESEEVEEETEPVEEKE